MRNQMTRVANLLGCLTGALVLWAFAIGPTVWAAGTSNVLTGYSITSWTESETGPLGAVAAIAQDSEGYLWIGSSAGLFRFDGVRFVEWTTLGDQPLPTTPVSALQITRDGTKWVGLANRAGVAMIRGRSLKLIGAGQMRVVTAIVEDRIGTLWAVAEPSL